MASARETRNRQRPAFSPQAVRPLFPALSMQVEGTPALFLDNPGGTQVPRQVVDAMARCLTGCNSNHGGVFHTSLLLDQVVREARKAGADLINAPDPGQIIFGPNMTSLTFSLSRSLAREWGPGDEVVVTSLDHDANVTPWALAAADAGAEVRMVDFDPADCSLPLERFARIIGPKTRLVALGWASNATGGVNDLPGVVELARRHGALVFVDAVAYAPHAAIDVAALDCDFLVCSAYKFFGPHLGMLWGKPEHLMRLTPYKVRPASDEIPDRWETGTGNWEAMAGFAAAVDYLAWLGDEFAPRSGEGLAAFTGRKRSLKAAFSLIREYEAGLSRALLRAVQGVDGVRVLGPDDPEDVQNRLPTVCFSWPGRHPTQIARFLAERGIFAWDGHYYALNFMELMGLNDTGGAVRLGAVHYNTLQEIDRLAEALTELSRR